MKKVTGRPIGQQIRDVVVIVSAHGELMKLDDVADSDDWVDAHEGAIKRIAESDPAYAWRASNHYQRLGELGKSSNPLFRDLPQQFIDF